MNALVVIEPPRSFEEQLISALGIRKKILLQPVISIKNYQEIQKVILELRRRIEVDMNEKKGKKDA